MYLRSCRLLPVFCFLLVLPSSLFSQSPLVNNPLASDSTHLFTARLQFQGKTFTGYLGVKYVDPHNFRLSFNTGMGSTLLDLEWIDGEMVKHYVPEKMDRKIVMNKLQDDFEMMMLHMLENGKWKNDSTLKKDCHKYRFTVGEQQWPYKVEDRNWIGRLKRTLEFGYGETKKLQTVRLKHHSFALQIDLTTIE